MKIFCGSLKNQWFFIFDVKVDSSNSSEYLNFKDILHVSWKSFQQLKLFLKFVKCETKFLEEKLTNERVCSKRNGF